MLDPNELRQLKVLDGVGLESIEGHLARGQVRHLVKGQALLTMGKPGKEMHLILSGRLGVHEGGPSTEPVTFLEAGETVGEVSVLDGRPAASHVVAVEGAKVLSIGEPLLWTLVELSHDFAINVLGLIAQRLFEGSSDASDPPRRKREHKRAALVDVMTGLYNRRWLDESLPRFVNRFVHGSRELCVLMIDLDHFGRYNAAHGHTAGDAALVTCANVLRTGFRPTDQVVRYGGEEFAVILPDADATGGRVAAGRVRRMVAATKVKAGEKSLPGVTISVGGSMLRGGDTASALVARADAALYASKQAGRDRVTFADEIGVR